MTGTNGKSNVEQALDAALAEVQRLQGEIEKGQKQVASIQSDIQKCGAAQLTFIGRAQALRELLGDSSDSKASAASSEGSFLTEGAAPNPAAN